MRQVFNDSLQAREWEHKVLRRISVIGNDRWLNKTDNISISPECCSCPGNKNGMFGKSHSEEVRKIISQNRKGKYQITDERRKQLSEQNRGENNPNYGKHTPHSEETKRKISESAYKMWESEEHRNNMSEKHKKYKGVKNGFYGRTHSEEWKKRHSEIMGGRTLTEEHKKKIGIKHQGSNNGFYGKTHSEETKRKISETKKRNYELKRSQNDI